MLTAFAAISISEQIEKYGAYAGLAAIVGLGVLSLLYFAQAREVKRLREWAGRAPERAAELEARVAADAARRTTAAPLRPQTAAGQAATAPTTAAAGGAPVQGDAKPPATTSPPTPVPGLPIPVPAATASAAAAGGTSTEVTAPPSSEPASPGAANGSPTTPESTTPSPTTLPPVEPVVGPRVPGRPPPTGPTPPVAPPAFPAPEIRPLRSGPPSRSVPLREDPERHRRMPSRRVLGVLGGSLLVVVAVIVVLVLTLGGDDTPPPPNQVAETVANTTAAEPGRTQASRQARVDRASTPVLVLNGTGVQGLARQVADRLQSTGYRADADNTQARDATLVAYKSGAEAAAREISRLLEVPSAQVQPMPADLSAQAGVHAVVVVIGADKASG